MGEDPCRSLREKYDSCFQKWVDSDYFQGKVTGPMIPCEADLKVYHDCIKTDSRRAVYLEKLEEYKKQFPLE